MRAAVRSLVVRPTRPMKTGIRGTRHRDQDGRDPVGAGHHGDDRHRDDDGQEELGQVAREVAVERVDAGRDEHAEAPAVLAVQPGRAQGGDVRGGRACRSSDLAEAEARWAARSVAQASSGAPDDHRQQEAERGRAARRGTRGGRRRR